MIAMMEFPLVLFNLMVLIYLSVFYFAWFEHARPFRSNVQHYLERLNELILLALCYHMLCYTDLTLIDSQITVIQSSFLAIIGILVILNILSVINTAVDFQVLKVKYQSIVIKKRTLLTTKNNL